MDEPIKTFELSTVTYGTTSAPFLATRMLKQLALDEAENFPLGSSVVMSDMYIDDVLTGAEILLEAKELKNQLINIFAKGAVHLDIVTDLTFNAFIATLKRFIFRRGKCAKLYSDNATNFVDANIELKKMFHLVCKPDEALASYMASEGIDWKFLPPRALNFGGLWKARVKSFKFYLKRVVGRINNIYPGKDSKVRVVEVKTTRAYEVMLKKEGEKEGTLYRVKGFTVEKEVINLDELKEILWEKRTK
ncbi:integrase catalytic domain-containing protein [Trichonephila clavipes]|nr:integrase catalytic domain-containing protein [Trichonephila clavipes]